ncbi:MAG: hypothetical protein HGB32_14990 [Geobacteraceae bacterium]|nr:hypothetical protein [Geobacteraceae bacterium]NTW81430.1 hypothetical protein [Geobacteraceae bacterium]
MPLIKLRAETLAHSTAFHLVVRAQSSIASYLHFGNGDLSKFLERDSFLAIATRLTDHFFHRSAALAIHAQVVDLYLALLIMAPILQRLPLSAKFDWHRGHLTGFFRSHVNGRKKRYHFASRTVNRTYSPEDLVANLDRLGVHDAGIVALLLDLYRRHAGGTALKDLLAHQLFDPILMSTLKQGYELRHGNRFFRLEKAPFPGSIDLRREAVTLLDFQMFSVEHTGGHHLEIFIAENSLAEFRENVTSLLGSATDPEYKAKRIETYIRDLVERTRPARSALPQLLELKLWLITKLRKLAGNSPEVMILPHLLVNLWLQRSDSRLYLKDPNFFLNSSHSEKTFVTFFSPYREV